MTLLAAKKLSASVALLALAVAPLLVGGTGRSSPPGVSVLLRSHNPSLTAYLAGATSEQGVTPIPLQRSVRLDGSLRAAPTLPLHLAANPLGTVWSANRSVNGVSLATGAYSALDTDIALPSEVPWRIARTYNSRQSSGGYQGNNWFQCSQPEIVMYWEVDSETKDEDDLLYIVLGADRYIECKRYADDSNEFAAVNGAAGGVLLTEGSPDVYTYTDQWGYQFAFFGFDTADNRANGQFWNASSPDGDVAYVGDATSASTAVSDGYWSHGGIKYAWDSSDRRYSYSYDGNDRLEQVKAETKSGGTWASPTGLQTRATVDYEYYGSSESHGVEGDLKLVTITTPLSDSGVSSVRKKYYR